VIIGLTGYAGSGKDTVAKALRLRHGFYRLSFADKLKELALRLDPSVYHLVEAHGWEYAKNELPGVREYLQNLGHSVREVIGEDAWVMATRAQLIGHLQEGHHVVYTDVRYENECAFVKANGGIVVRVERPGVEAVNSHVSDTGISALPTDDLLLNDGTITQLGQKASELVEKYM